MNFLQGGPKFEVTPLRMSDSLCVTLRYCEHRLEYLENNVTAD